MKSFFLLMIVLFVTVPPSYAQFFKEEDVDDPAEVADTFNEMRALVRFGDGVFTQAALGKAAVDFAKANALGAANGDSTNEEYQKFVASLQRPTPATRTKIAQIFVTALINGAAAGGLARAELANIHSRLSAVETILAGGGQAADSAQATSAQPIAPVAQLTAQEGRSVEIDSLRVRLATLEGRMSTVETETRSTRKLLVEGFDNVGKALLDPRAAKSDRREGRQWFLEGYYKNPPTASGP